MSHRDFPFITDWSVIWMALPVEFNGDYAYLSVAAAARLCGPSSSWRWRLGNNTPWADWPAELGKTDFTFSVEIDGETQPRSCAIVTRSDLLPSSADWKALFRPSMYVEPFDSGTFSTQTAGSPVVMSYDGRTLEQLLQKEYTTPPAPVAAPGSFSAMATSAVCGDILKQKFTSWSDVIAQYELCMSQSFPQDSDQYPHQQLSAFLLFHSSPPPPVYPPQKPLLDTMAAVAAAAPDVTVEIAAAPDGQVLYADPFCENGVWTTPRFVLPSIDDVWDGFRVTIRSLSEQPSEVKTKNAGERIFAVGDHTGVAQRSFTRTTHDVVYRAFRSGWLAEEEGDLDFHTGLSALSAYPSLLRRLGLVHDLRFEWKPPRQSGRIRVVAKIGTSGVGVSPWTTFVAERDLFTTDYRVTDASKRIQKGFFARYADDVISQLDLDGGVSKLILQHTQASDGQPALQVTDDRSEIRGITQPSLRQNGLALLPAEMPASIETAVARTQEQFAATQATMSTATSNASCLASTITELGTEDLIQGFRIDVRRVGKDGFAMPWRNLCVRRASYLIPGRPLLQTDDDGFVSTVVDEVRDKDAAALRITNALFRWDGWSLSVERPGRGVSDSGEAIETFGAARPNLPLVVRTDPIAGSLTRLRFGSQYEFRVRAVDLAGNSIAGALADAGTTESTRFSSEPYVRFEPVDAPIVIGLESPGLGETSDLLVVRSSRHGFEGRRRWRLFPPKAAMSLVELHGVFDGMSATESWTELSELDGEAPSKTDDAYGPPHYLADPLARGAALCGLTLDGTHRTLAFYGTDALQWSAKKARSVSVHIDTGEYRVDADYRAIFVRLPPGRWMKVRLSSYLKGTDVPLMGIWRWRKGSTVVPSDTEYMELIERGEAEALTPSRELTLLHAVARPLVPCGEKKIRFRTLRPTRTLGETTARLDFDLAIDVPSSGKVDVRADWTEQIDDPGVPAWYVSTSSAEAFEARVPVPKLEVADLAADCSTIRPDLVTFQGAGEHKFNDTKHRRVSYTAIVTTRFVDQFKQHGTRESVKMAIDIPNTTPPAVADVFYIVPTYSRHNEERKRSGRTRKVRGGGGLRIYMPRGWFSSGDDERLAIVLPSERTMADDDPLRHRITEWGIDPLWRGRALPPRLELEHFVNKEGSVLDLETQIRVGGSEGMPAKTEIVKVHLAFFPVRQDENKNLLYADVHVAAGDAYWPFIRFALARYQPYSTKLAHLSEIQRAAFVQVAPTRSVTLKAVGPARYRIAVSGPAYEPGKPVDETGAVWAKPFPQIVVRVEEGLPEHDSPSLRWVAVPNIEAELPGRSVGSLWVWEGELDLKRTHTRNMRFVVSEYQHFPGGTTKTIPSRLSYAEVIDATEVWS